MLLLVSYLFYRELQILPSTVIQDQTIEMCMEFEMKSESSVVNEGCKKQQQQNQNQQKTRIKK